MSSWRSERRARSLARLANEARYGSSSIMSFLRFSSWFPEEAYNSWMEARVRDPTATAPSGSESTIRTWVLEYMDKTNRDAVFCHLFMLYVSGIDMLGDLTSGAVSPSAELAQAAKACRGVLDQRPATETIAPTAPYKLHEGATYTASFTGGVVPKDLEFFSKSYKRYIDVAITTTPAATNDVGTVNYTFAIARLNLQGSERVFDSLPQKDDLVGRAIHYNIMLPNGWKGATGTDASDDRLRRMLDLYNIPKRYRNGFLTHKGHVYLAYRNQTEEEYRGSQIATRERDEKVARATFKSIFENGDLEYGTHVLRVVVNYYLHLFDKVTVEEGRALHEKLSKLLGTKEEQAAEVVTNGKSWDLWNTNGDPLSNMIGVLFLVAIKGICMVSGKCKFREFCNLFDNETLKRMGDTIGESDPHATRWYFLPQTSHANQSIVYQDDNPMFTTDTKSFAVMRVPGRFENHVLVVPPIRTAPEGQASGMKTVDSARLELEGIVMDQVGTDEMVKKRVRPIVEEKTSKMSSDELKDAIKSSGDKFLRQIMATTFTDFDKTPSTKTSIPNLELDGALIEKLNSLTSSGLPSFTDNMSVDALRAAIQLQNTVVKELGDPSLEDLAKLLVLGFMIRLQSESRMKSTLSDSSNILDQFRKSTLEQLVEHRVVDRDVGWGKQKDTFAVSIKEFTSDLTPATFKKAIQNSEAFLHKIMAMTFRGLVMEGSALPSDGTVDGIVRNLTVKELKDAIQCIQDTGDMKLFKSTNTAGKMMIPFMISMTPKEKEDIFKENNEFVKQFVMFVLKTLVKDESLSWVAAESFIEKRYSGVRDAMNDTDLIQKLRNNSAIYNSDVMAKKLSVFGGSRLKPKATVGNAVELYRAIAVVLPYALDIVNGVQLLRKDGGGVIDFEADGYTGMTTAFEFFTKDAYAMENAKNAWTYLLRMQHGTGAVWREEDYLPFGTLGHWWMGADKGTKVRDWRTFKVGLEIIVAATGREGGRSNAAVDGLDDEGRPQRDWPGIWDEAEFLNMHITDAREQEYRDELTTLQYLGCIMATYGNLLESYTPPHGWWKYVGVNEKTKPEDGGFRPDDNEWRGINVYPTNDMVRRYVDDVHRRNRPDRLMKRLLYIMCYANDQHSSVEKGGVAAMGVAGNIIGHEADLFEETKNKIKAKK